MDPITLAIGAAGVGAAGSLIQGYGNAKAAGQQAAASDYNANLSDQQADTAFAQGVQRETQQRSQAAQQLGTQRAAVSESGFNPSSGSALDLQVSSTGNAELDALQTRYQGILQGKNFEDQANVDRYQANMQRSNAKSALISGFIGAGTSALTGYSNFAKLGAAAGLGGIGGTAGYSSSALLRGLGYGG